LSFQPFHITANGVELEKKQQLITGSIMQQTCHQSSRISRVDEVAIATSNFQMLTMAQQAGTVCELPV
jgi:CMP-2-keto-3-deoxyoctulosonic acid synthetase